MINVFQLKLKFIAKLIKFRILRFIISGGIAAAVNLTLLFALVHFIKMWYLLATNISYVSSIIVSFTMQKFFAFNDYSRDKILRQSIFYFVFQGINVSINTFLMFLSVDLLNLHYMVSQVIVGGMIALYSFFIYRNIIFYPNNPEGRG